MKKTSKERISIKMIIILLVLIGILMVFLYTGMITGKIVDDNYPDYYSHTRAICNENTNGWLCQDYVIECRDNEALSITPITGAIIQNSKDWQDPRPETERNLSRLCG